MMRKIAPLLLFVGSAAIAAAQVSSSNVESVDYSAKYNTYYFSNNSSGSINQMDALYNVTALGSADGSHGLEVIGDTLFACDGGRIKGYQLPSGTQVININLGGTFLNGITHKGDDIYVTDFSAGKIYHIDRWTLNYWTYVNSTPSTPNGIIYDDISDRLVYVSWGSNADIYEIDMSDSTVTMAKSTTLGNMDGIHIDCDGNFYVSTWSPNRISKFSNDFTVGPTNMGATGLSNPADIYYNRNTDTLAIANSGNSTVSFEYYANCIATDVTENKVSVEFNIHPNPASGQTTLHIEASRQVDFNVDVIDIKGSVVFSTTHYSKAGVNTINIDLEGLESGVYFVQLLSDVYTQAQKLIIR